MAVADPVKPEAAGVVAALGRAGLACHMLTGDNWVTARVIAAQLGIRHVTAEVGACPRHTPAPRTAAASIPALRQHQF